MVLFHVETENDAMAVSLILILIKLIRFLVKCIEICVSFDGLQVCLRSPFSRATENEPVVAILNLLI